MYRLLPVRTFTWIAALALAWLVVPGTRAGPSDCSVPSAICSPQPAIEWSSLHKVTPRLLAELDAGKEADVLVFVRGRPDLTPARAFSTREARGRFVVKALRATAERTQAGLRRLLDVRGADYRPFWIVNMLRVRADRALIAELSGRPEVRRIDINIVTPGLEPEFDVDLFPKLMVPTATPPWGISSIGAPSVWQEGVRGQGIVVAGNDTGVDWTHEALIDAYRGWDGVSADHNYNWHDAWAKTPLEPSDDHGHGTHTIGTVAGSGPQQIGVAPDAKWMACRNMNSGFGTPAAYVDCFQFFLAPTDLQGNNPRPDLSPHIVNNSWACVESEGCHPDDPLWNDTIGPAVGALTEAGIAVVVSAGNSGPACQSVRYPPAIYPQSLTVGATDSSNRIADFSSRGPVTVNGSGLPAPDLAAPGVDVRSSFPGNRYVKMSGTSMAGPHVAGTLALLWSAEPQLVGRLAVTEQVLRASAMPIADDACGGDPDSQPNNVYGWGRINADTAVQTATTLQELQGLVTDIDGNPLPGADVRIVGLTWGVEVDSLTGADGRYASPLLPGSYQVAVDTPAHFAESDLVSVPADGPLVHDVALAACVDWDGDGYTRLFEIQTVAGDWDKEGFEPGHDLNRDGVVDVIDVAILAAHFDEPCSVG